MCACKKTQKERDRQPVSQAQGLCAGNNVELLPQQYQEKFDVQQKHTLAFDNHRGSGMPVIRHPTDQWSHVQLSSIAFKLSSKST